MMWELSHSQGAMPCFVPLNDFPMGFMYGMAVYTTFRLPLADCWLEAHLDRLAANAQQLGITLAFPPDVIRQALASESRLEQAVLRLTAVADVQEYSDLYAQPLEPARLLLSVRQAPGAKALPLALKSVDYVRPRPLIKHLGMAEVIRLKQQASLEGFGDILLASNAQVREASTSNVFFIQAGTLLTPDPVHDGCLPGITRLRLLATAQAQGIAVQQASPIQLAGLAQMEGAFLTNAAQGIRPVARIDDWTFPWPDSAREVMDCLAASLT